MFSRTLLHLNDRRWVSNLSFDQDEEMCEKKANGNQHLANNWFCRHHIDSPSSFHDSRFHIFLDTFTGHGTSCNLFHTPRKPKATCTNGKHPKLPFPVGALKQHSSPHNGSSGSNSCLEHRWGGTGGIRHVALACLETLTCMVWIRHRHTTIYYSVLLCIQTVVIKLLKIISINEPVNTWNMKHWEQAEKCGL